MSCDFKGPEEKSSLCGWPAVSLWRGDIPPMLAAQSAFPSRPWASFRQEFGQLIWRRTFPLYLAETCPFSLFKNNNDSKRLIARTTPSSPADAPSFTPGLLYALRFIFQSEEISRNH